MPLLPGIVELRTVHNYGAAWSSFSGQRWLLLGVTCCIILVILFLLTRRIVRHPVGLAACFLIISGGIGNIMDRFRLGFVVDMFQLLFMNFAVFNVADICVVVGGIAAAAYYLLLADKLEHKEAPHGTADADR